MYPGCGGFGTRRSESRFLLQQLLFLLMQIKAAAATAAAADISIELATEIVRAVRGLLCWLVALLWAVVKRHRGQGGQRMRGWMPATARKKRNERNKRKGARRPPSGPRIMIHSSLW